MADRIGIEIASFRIESEVGRGGMGVVYLAHQAFPERRVALKLLSPDLAADPSFRERFIRESNAAASTEHPHIVPVYGAGEADGQLYLAMRYVDGTDLGSLLAREGRLSPDRAARICAEIADALEAAHERGLIHRDVKPGNILLDGRDHAYLTDFGLIRRTRLQTEITKTGQFMGTVDYVAPEQIRGQELDGRADVYSLGCVLYECITGSPPFARDSEVATVYAHLEDAPPRPASKRPGVSPVLASIVQKAMAKRPDERFADAGEMADALRGGPRRPRRRPPSRRLALAGVAVILAIVAVLVLLPRDGGISSGEPPSTEAVPPLNSLAQIDAETGEVRSAARIPALRESRPRVEVGEGGVWVMTVSDLVHVDPDDGEIVTTTSTGAGSFAIPSLAVGYRTVWVGAPTQVLRIDPSDDQPLRPVRLGQPGTFINAALATGESKAWAVAADGTLYRIEPFAGRIEASADVGQSAAAIDVGFDRVWVLDDLRGTLTSVDPRTMQVERAIPLAATLSAVAVGAGAAWVLDASAGVVVPIDPVSGSPGSPVRVGLQPTDVATGLGAVWVTNQGDGTISRIDPVTRRVETIDVGAPVSALAVDERGRAVWAIVAESQVN